jgi:hypothetical protein
MGDIKTALQFSRECRALGCGIIDAAVKIPGSSLEKHAAVFAARATTAMESVEVLAEAGLNADATSVGRTINEMAIDLAFIMKEKTEERLALFFGHEAVRDWHLVQAISKLHGGKVNQKAMAEVEARYNAVKADYPNAHQWCGTIRYRARETQLEYIYELSYAEGCASSHSGAQGLSTTALSTSAMPRDASDGVRG